jgi:hypothetical protein
MLAKSARSSVAWYTAETLVITWASACRHGWMPANIHKTAIAWHTAETLLIIWHSGERVSIGIYHVVSNYK